MRKVNHHHPHKLQKRSIEFALNVSLLLNLCLFQLRETVFQFAQKELAPKADEIDKTNGFPGIRVRNLSGFFFFFCFFLYDMKQ